MTNGNEIRDVQITVDTVKRAIDHLKEQSASGPDEIPPRVMKELRNEIAVPLTILFRHSIKTGEIPDEWRDAVVTPIFKQGRIHGHTSCGWVGRGGNARFHTF